MTTSKKPTKPETDEERYQRYLLLRDDPTQTPDIRHAASKAVEIYEAQRLGRVN